MNTPSHLKDSEYRWRTGLQGDREQLKSCPRCSVSAGHLVYHPLDDFGLRTIRGKVIAQSYCKKCRAEAAKAGA